MNIQDNMNTKELHKEELCYSIAEVIDHYGRGWNTKAGAMLILADELYYFLDEDILSKEQIKILTERFQDFLNSLDIICNEIK